ncbi:MAG: 23S rRNA (pseudouridine(1915)-N(3))-methyltransferase RlmH [Chromatiaceae bacterium]|nr:23S rRNA (pseudouridine(1915)-N(3))-methyltransferase RlmH [Gammaproteobacteria bacterium]MCP5422916.1 23S rRNA (pseudouridine(1915)-N(3))-methyltransferase RlmH [Chromatiaceae bacterium]
MNGHLIAVGDRMPRWVQLGFDEYARRLPAECTLRLVEIAAGRRMRNADIPRIVRDETTRVLSAIPKGARAIALEVGGQRWSTEQLAERLDDWMADGRDLALMVGGPDGLGEAARAAAELQWSLSPLTLPHPLVRVIVAEQLYRAWSLLRNHPYHRA